VCQVEQIDMEAMVAITCSTVVQPQLDLPATVEGGNRLVQRPLVDLLCCLVVEERRS